MVEVVLGIVMCLVSCYMENRTRELVAHAYSCQYWPLAAHLQTKYLSSRYTRRLQPAHVDATLSSQHLQVHPANGFDEQRPNEQLLANLHSQHKTQPFAPSLFFPKTVLLETSFPASFFPRRTSSLHNWRQSGHMLCIAGVYIDPPPVILWHLFSALLQPSQSVSISFAEAQGIGWLS